MRLPAIAALLVLATPFAAAETPVSPAVRLNTVGFLPDARKEATVASGAGSFKVIDAAGATVLEQPLAGPVKDADTDETLWFADFSAVQKPGSYQLVVDGVAGPTAFLVTPDAFTDAYRTTARGMYLWRCGTAVKGEHQGSVFEQMPCHLADAWLDHVTGEHERRDTTGGWHDAGDHNKYIVNAAVTVGSMLQAWQDFGPALGTIELGIPESDGPIPDLLAEVKWEMDWFFKMQAHDGSVYHKLSTLTFGGMIMPDVEDTPRYLTTWSTAATAGFVATMAKMARVMEPYDKAYAARCLEAALKSHALLTRYPQDVQPELKKFKTGAYTTPDPDDRLWAIAELWETTGEKSYLGELEARIRFQGTKVDQEFGWGAVKNLGLFTYLTSKRAGRDPAFVAAVRADLVATADRIVAVSRDGGYARPLGSSYSWGCNGAVATQAMLLQTAFRVTGDPAYRDTALHAVDHLLGRNYFGRSMITGVGGNPPLHPHCRRSAGDKVEAPWPGYLVGGPQKGARDWQDLETRYQVNEIAINWNGAMIYALAGFLPAP